MKSGLKKFQMFVEASKSPNPDNLSLIIDYAFDEGEKFTSEVAAGIATIEHQRNVLEAIYTMAGKALGKF